VNGRVYHSSVVFNNALWIIAGVDSNGPTDTWSTTDGDNWNLVNATAFPQAYYGHTSVVYNGMMWLIGGIANGAAFTDDVYSSPDGSTWTLAPKTAPITPRYLHASVVYNNLMWVIDGYDGTFTNSILSSPDGATWTAPAPGTVPSGRVQPGAVVYNNMMWIIGGYDGTNLLNDVWNSSDGANWNLVLPNNPTPGPGQFTPRFGHTVVSYNGAMYVIGGFDGILGPNGDTSDVWSSTDGVTWSQVTPAASFTPRNSHTSEVFDPGTGLKMWVLCGKLNPNFGPPLLNDVWHSP
jgi:hypothetical protein